MDIRYYKYIADGFECYIHSRCSKIVTTTMDRMHKIPYLKTDGEFLYHTDYFRYSILTLLAEEIKKATIPGELAELGVYKGMFSRCINEFFPERKLYLFDTFEGFSQDDIDKEERQGYTNMKLRKNSFKDTDVGYVLRQMPCPENCIAIKGHFPETIPKEEINYALVSLDCDVYQPTLEGLRYFYPRLSPGGYIMIHDYNHEDRWLGVRQAVKEYEAECGKMVKVPIADKAGSLVIGKM